MKGNGQLKLAMMITAAAGTAACAVALVRKVQKVRKKVQKDQALDRDLMAAFGSSEGVAKY